MFLKQLRSITILLLIGSIELTPLAPALAADYATETFLSQDDFGNNIDATESYVDEPRGFDTDADDIYFLDTINNRVEKIGPDGVLGRVAGSGEYGYKDDSALFAQFAEPQDLAVYGEQGEQIFIADTNNNVVRKLENGQVSTFVEGLITPQGVEVQGDTVFISDTGHNRIIGINRAGGAVTEFAKNLNQPTKLLYWPEARSIIFVNAGEGAVRAINLNTGKLSEPLIADLEDIGGIYLQGRNLFVASSYSIGVFNEIWKVRLDKPNPSSAVRSTKTKRLTLNRETEHLNWPSDILVREDTLTWEEYYSWEPNVLYKAAAQEKEEPVCGLKMREAGQPHWRDVWYERITPEASTYQQNYILKSKYQGDQVYFRVRLQYDNKKLSPRKRQNQQQRNQSPWKQSRVFAAKNLEPAYRSARRATVTWKADPTATYYKVQLWHNDETVKTFKHVDVNKKKIPKSLLIANAEYNFRVKVCTDSACGEWSDYKTFRTLPAKVKRIGKIVPVRGVRMQSLPSGNFLATFQFRLHQPKKQLRAKIELCAKNTTHPETVTTNRLYVLYKGGSALLAWHNNATLPDLVAGKHRFQDEFGDQTTALLGRPKDVAFNSDQTKMYIAENNKLAVYDFSTQQLTELAGHVMDSYTEGIGTAARFSDPTALAVSPDNQWLYIVDRNNHRIRKVNTTSGETGYITGAGGKNFSFTSSDSNGYAEGGPCPDEFDQAVAGCAYFNRPTGLAVAPDGKTLYVAEGSNNRIRAVDIASGKTSLIAGDGAAGYKNGTGSGAQFNGPYSVDVSKDGKTLYVADKYNHAIRTINLSTKAVTTLVGQGTMGFRNGSFRTAALAIPEYVEEDNGVVYWTEAGTHTVRAAFLSSQQVVTLSGNGKPGFVNGLGKDAEWHNPKGFGFRAGKMYVADSTNDVVRTVTF